jgi:putative flippase GtrA
MKRSRILRFALVGAAGFIVDAGVLQLLSWGLGLEVHVARLLSFLAASAATWRLNRRYTFAAADARGGEFWEWLRYLWSSAAGGLVNYGAFALFIAVAGAESVQRLVGVAVGSLAGMCVNYALYSLYVFRSPQPPVLRG